MSSIMSYNAFEIKSKNHTFNKDLLQYTPLHLVFAVKHDLRHKVRLVMGGHMTNASNNDKYATTIKLENILLSFSDF